MKKLALLLLIGCQIFAGTIILASTSPDNPNRLSFLIRNSSQNPEIEVVLKGRIRGHLRGQGPREVENWSYSQKTVLKTGEIKRLTIDNPKYEHFHWHWGPESNESYTYIIAKPKNASDDEAACMKIIACNNAKWDYKIAERRLGNLNLWIWNNGYRRDYNGHFIPGNFGDDTSDIEWSSYAKIDGNHGETRDGVVAVFIGKIGGYNPNPVSYSEYDAKGRLITLPYWGEKYFSGNCKGHGCDSKGKPLNSNKNIDPFPETE